MPEAWHVGPHDELGRTAFKVTPMEGVDRGGWEAVRQFRVLILFLDCLRADWSFGCSTTSALASCRPCTASPRGLSAEQPHLRTSCYDAYMSSVNVSVRLDEALAQRLRLRARAAGESLSDRLRRYAEEGARREEHPLVTFRDGPTGRRAGLLGGPDVWEVAMWLDDLRDEPDPAATLVKESSLTPSHVDAVQRYQAAYPQEIAARVELHRRETEAAERY
jgi:hypothetical protein